MTRLHCIVFTLIAFLLMNPAAFAQEEGTNEFSIDWYTIDGGGWTVTGIDGSGNDFVCSGIVGQPDADSVGLTGGDFKLTGGFWSSSGVIPCFGDTNNDQTVNVDDLLVLIGAWGPNTTAADLNDDGTVNVDDLLDLIGAWGPCP